MPLPTPYRFAVIHFHWLGLDVTLGTLVTYLAASRLPGGNSTGSVWLTILLGLGTAGVYLLYFLVDNRRNERPESSRMAFFREHRPLIKKVIGTCVTLSLVFSWLIPGTLRLFAIVIVLTSALFLWSISKLPLKNNVRAVKEPLMAAIYTSGVWGSTWFLATTPSWESKALGGVFFLILLQNLLLTAHFEAVQYKGTYNLARWLRRASTLKIVYGISIVVLLAACVVIYYTEFRYTQRLSILLVLFSFAHLVLLRNAEKVIAHERYSVFGKLFLLIPALAL